MTGHHRAGAALAELTLAILIASVAAAIGVAILVTAERRTRADAASDRTTQSARDVATLLTAEVEAALPDSIAARGDTALDLHAHVGASVVCVVAGAALVVPGASAASGVPFTFWRQPPEAGDLLLAWDSSGGGRWHRAAIDSVSTPAAGGGCATSSGFRTVADSLAQIAVTRLRLDGTVPAGVVSGAPVRVFRAGRWFLHRGSDHAWALAYRRCSPGACGTAQPVAGPLAAPADSGLVFDARVPGTVELSARAAGAAVRTRLVVVARGAPHGPP